MRSGNNIGATLIAQVCDGLLSLRWLTAMQLLIVGTGMSFAQGRVGINTLTPHAMLHVKDSNVVFTGASMPLVIPGPPPSSGGGVRMMWYSDKAAFRAGYVYDSHWDRDSIGVASFAAGQNVKAGGLGSVALGLETTASGLCSHATGYITIASGSYATAMGYNSRASGFGSTAMYGGNASGSGATAMAIGTASGNFSTAMGNNTLSSGESSIAMGQNTIASGLLSTSLGFSTKAAGRLSTAMGYATQANGYASLVIGQYNDTLVAAQTAISSTTPLFIVGNGDSGNLSNAMVVRKDGNTGIGTSTPSTRLHVSKGGSGGSYNQDSPLIIEDDHHAYLQFSIPMNRECGLLAGNAVTSIRAAVVFEADSSLSLRTGGNNERMTIRSSGNIGIGTATPGTRLHVSKGTGGLFNSGASMILEDDTHHYLQLSSPNASQTGILSGNAATTIRSGITFNADSSISILTAGNIGRMRVTKTGNVGIGTNSPSEKLHVEGNICYTGSIAACSDIRYKKDFEPVENTLAKLRGIGVYKYSWKAEAFPDKSFTDERQIGVIAQEVEKIFPEIVSSDSQGFLSMDYARLSVLLLAAMKEQHLEIQSLHDKVRSQQKDIDRLQNIESRLAALENRLGSE